MGRIHCLIGLKWEEIVHHKTNQCTNDLANIDCTFECSHLMLVDILEIATPQLISLL
jgi:hypothetical protein